MKDKTVKINKKDIVDFLDKLNSEYLKIHKTYEDLFWVSYMGDNSIDDKFKKAKSKLNEFRSNRALAEQTNVFF